MKRRRDDEGGLFPKVPPKPEELPPCHACHRAASFTQRNVERPTEEPLHFCRDHIPETPSWSFMKKTEFRFFEEVALRRVDRLGASPAADKNPFA